MSRLRGFLILLFLLPILVPPSFAATTAGPDADGAWQLNFAFDRAEGGSARLTLDVRREDADGVILATRDLGEVTLVAGANIREVAFLPGEGPGRYDVALVVDGVAVDAASFDVSDAGAEQTVRFDVPDEPTYLNLTGDSVNADGKTKAPGDALVTRATLSDRNGVGDITALVWRVERGGGVIHTGTIDHGAAPESVQASIEHRFEYTPMPAGDHVLVIEARKHGQVVAAASRTFTIREVAPTLVAGALPNVTPDEERILGVDLLLADRNGAPGPGPFEARVYRGSSRAEASGIVATLGEPVALADANGTGRAQVPLTLRVPANASAGALRVSIYHDGALLGALPFDILPLPSLESVHAATEGAGLLLTVQGAGAGLLTARLTDGAGSTTTRAVAFDRSAQISLDAPRAGVTLRWSLELRARDEGPVLAQREGDWSAPHQGPSLRMTPVHARDRLPASWQLEAEGWALDGSQVQFTFTRWDGQDEPRLDGSLREGRVRVHGPPDLDAGRYFATLRISFENGTTSETRWDFGAGPWIELDLGAPVVEERVAWMPVRNVGGLPITKLVVEVQQPARVALVVDGATIVPRMNGARAAFDDLALAPGAGVQLRVELPAGPLAGGTHSVAVRILARMEVA